MFTLPQTSPGVRGSVCACVCVRVHVCDPDLPSMRGPHSRANTCAQMCGCPCEHTGSGWTRGEAAVLCRVPTTREGPQGRSHKRAASRALGAACSGVQGVCAPSAAEEPGHPLSPCSAPAPSKCGGNKRPSFSGEGRGRGSLGGAPASGVLLPTPAVPLQQNRTRSIMRALGKQPRPCC